LPALKLSLRLPWFHWAIVVGAVSLTLTVWHNTHQQLLEKSRQRFDSQAEQLVALVVERMARYEDALRSGVAAIASQSHGLDADEWSRFAQTLHIEENLPGINGIGVIYAVPRSMQNAFLTQQRVLRPNFSVYPKHDQDPLWPITYIEPIETNQVALGLDIASEPKRLEAALLARDTNSVRITAPIKLVQGTRKLPGFLQFMPFYAGSDLANLSDRQEHFIGHIYAPFFMRDLINGTLDQKNRPLAFQVRDGDTIFYDELSADFADKDNTPLFKKSHTIDMYGRPWTFDMVTTHQFRRSASSLQANLILIGGLLIDALLVGFMLLARARGKAVRHAAVVSEQLGDSERYFRQIIEIAPCGIIILDEQDQITAANPYSCKLLGYSDIKLIGQKTASFMESEVFAEYERFKSSPLVQSRWASISPGLEASCRTSDGRLFPAELSAAHLSHEGEKNILLTIVDTTSRVETTQDLQRSNNELKEFAFIASHDLKAPLRGIMRLASWVEEDLQGKGSEETLQNLKLIQNRTARLEKLLDDLLTYSRVGRDVGELREVELAELIRDVFDLVVPPAGFELEFASEMPKITTLVVPLQVIFRNLISNAIKHHNGSSGKVTVSVNEQSNWFEFSVCDDGPGIDPKFHKSIFGLFNTLQPRDEVEGSGMGLSIVKKMLDAQRCTIKVDSMYQAGTCFVFSWPKSKLFTLTSK